MDHFERIDDLLRPSEDRITGPSSIVILVQIIGLIAILSVPFVVMAAEQTNINLNTGTTLQLARLPGVSPELAKTIFDYRSKAGPFKTPGELLKVPGMTNEILTIIAPRIDGQGNLICSVVEDQEVREEFKMPAY
jgi:competence protein ComEA